MNQSQGFARFWNLAAFSERVDKALGTSSQKNAESNVLSFGSQQ
jgi:hypothetical protein